jgi:hypothetical protein
MQLAAWRPVHRSPATRNEVRSLGEGGCFLVQQTVSLSGICAVVGRSLFLKKARDGKFPLEDGGTLIAYLRTK